MVHGNGFEIVDKANGVALPIPAHDFFEHGHDVKISICSSHFQSVKVVKLVKHPAVWGISFSHWLVD